MEIFKNNENIDKYYNLHLLNNKKEARKKTFRNS